MHLFVHALTLNISLLYLHGSGNTKKSYIHHYFLKRKRKRRGREGGREIVCFFYLNIQAI